MPDQRLSTQCCIAGGGPPGITLGLLLARLGVDVVVLEKHDDFFRDFRGDTIHPSTLDLIDQLGLRERFGAIPQTSITTLDLVISGTRLTPVDFSSLPGDNRRIALMPQWDFLSLLADEGTRYPNFRLLMGTEATGVLRRGDRITGVRARSGGEPLEISATLTVGADGRSSTLREATGLVPHSFGVPIDVLWFRLPVPSDPPPDTLGYLSAGSMLITIPRSDYYQMGLLIRKGDFAAIRSAGPAAFRQRISRAAPFLEPVLAGLTGWEQVKLLTVQVDRLSQWSLPGLLCIGDAAHAMSPVFGVGVNYAVQDAVAAALTLAPWLRRNQVPGAALRSIQRRRLLPVRLMQPIQLQVHKMLATSEGAQARPLRLWQKTALNAGLPVLRPLVARMVGRGFRPERL